MLLPFWSRRRDTARDMTVTHPMQVSTLARAETSSGHAAAEAYSRKMRQAAEGCQRQELVFIPLVTSSGREPGVMA